MKEFIEKMISRLEEELALADKEKERCVKKNPLQFDSAKGYASGVSMAIEIVNKLAKEYNDDFCEWQPNKQFNWFLKSPHEGVGITQEEKGFFKFCPYCGKKIKVVE